MDGTHQQNPDGTWSEAEPLPYIGWKARTEDWLRRRNRLPRVAAMLGRWDERRLGR